MTEMPTSREEFERILAAMPEDRRESFQRMMDVFRPWETLDPELERFTFDGPMGNKVIKHPLYYDIFFGGANVGMANDTLAKKKAAVAEAEAEGDWTAYVMLHERPWRLWAFLRISDKIADDRKFWALVGHIWTDSENLHENYDDWAEVLHTDRPGREFMMDDDERAELAKLPERIKIYRGYRMDDTKGWDGLDGFSWTRKRRIGQWFARRYDKIVGSKGLLATGAIDRENVVALFTGRGEHEIVALPEHVEIIRKQRVTGEQESSHQISAEINSELGRR